MPTLTDKQAALYESLIYTLGLAPTSYNGLPLETRRGIAQAYNNAPRRNTRRLQAIANYLTNNRPS